MKEIKFRAKRTDDDSEMIFFDLTEGSLNVPFIVENYAIMQYTGLKDKNGVEIYEGDIVNHHGFILKIVFYESGFTVQNTDSPNAMPASLSYLPAFAAVELQVIGNIYENPDLLKSTNRKDKV